MGTRLEFLDISIDTIYSHRIESSNIPESRYQRTSSRHRIVLSAPDSLVRVLRREERRGWR